MSNASSPSASAANAQSKPRLTEEEKRQNHIASEKKRRDAIRAGFDSLCDIVPGMKGQGRSEAVVLGKTVEHMKFHIEKKNVLRELALNQGWSEEAFENYYREAERDAKERQKQTAAGRAREAANS